MLWENELEPAQRVDVLAAGSAYGEAVRQLSALPQRIPNGMRVLATS